ncbi:MAG: hypothetical protein DWQ47_05675 [Acidobacteria bacterium]|nr:MAG: hypothetical protein DWQ32_09225 [Acidobacteriota bacterium]REK01869.1 MAG: hypothetical protein DWQ38_05660 [Acidobacteriota bacterium]REK14825.1 MAG: hypothetical protein DWQ43_14915 [Acidobacteriota bacterium]REK45540.1 MAG: hypothetical protein DWQ47_05675 [Acidobacteriota bacterium]
MYVRAFEMSGNLKPEIRMRIVVKSVHLIALFLALLVPVQAQRPATEQLKLTSDAWQEDLRYMAKELESRHRNLFHSVTREDFDLAVRSLEKKIPTLEDHEVLIELMRIVAMVRDGHTRLRLELAPRSRGVYPLRFYWFKDGLFVQSAAPEHKDLVGGKLLGIGELSVEQAIDAVREITWRDNEMGTRNIAPLLLAIPEVLNGLGISDSLDRTTFTFDLNGKRVSRELGPGGELPDLLRPPDDWKDAAEGEKPLWLRDPRNYHWFNYLAEEKVLFVQFNRVLNKREESVEDFFTKVFGFAEKNPAEKLVIDLRHNDGGNSVLNRPMILGIIKSRFNTRGRLFVLIGRQTFSAAQQAVNELEKWTEAIFVGEPTGSTPNHFGDATEVTLPNSGLRLRISTLWWQTVDPRDTRQWKAPDIEAELTSEDYILGRDPAIQAVISFK